ncbi:DUF928 domain-containing protein [Leptolyngbya cf. ectocarpi LEGE 11479]|uniref:DUF928 domain-containing protein n=1 Tax=Leptolyngbya cf. ectocarpi LEGE 11479 TaxID=1828722 RepID=A0A929FB28_LEPEC|nr:DUF928 domain-containing protein [Leptolyngbya ectocarpi]MBE9068363.1 DUF928 domain-containing protein [Leptolyngbya cf. ectocarpi LEGE 11479]
MTAHTASILSKLTHTTSLCLGLLTMAQISTHASTHISEVSEHSLDLVSIADNHAVIDNSGNNHDRRRFRPTDDTRPIPPTPLTAGSRGGSCNVEEEPTEFTALGPRSIAELTTQVRPEFSWYVSPSEEGAQLQFRLMQIDENGQLLSLVNTKSFIAQAGFMSYQPPSEATPLEVGKDYLWQVVITCSSDDLLMSTLPIRVVTPSAELTAQLSTATTNAERAIIYGSAGLWYDALAQVMSSTAPDDRTIRAGLLQDLAVVEEEDNQEISTILLAIIEQTDDR